MKITTEEKKKFEEDGYLIVRNLFSEKEIQALSKKAHNDRKLNQASSSMDDGKGNAVRLSLWNHPGDGLYGMFSRSKRLVDRVEDLLGGEVYHYHSKIVLKDAKIGGAWAWHQDYGYWYQNGLLFPDLISVMIAVDKATKENGCLQVIKGSHKLGRINHVLSGDQAGADMERVQEALKIQEKVYCEMEPGDALFFHSNTLHASDANNSDQSRWTMICAYNKASNNPYKESHHPSYTKLHKVEDEMIMTVASRDSEGSEVEFADLSSEDKSAKSLDGGQ
ncbi:phytanoyl-CoA dioxygenase family protein [Salegentibacter mishustinae]|uniref:phytanoyl-CoA dioxygenase family protein n=1 Tax=Salegentibacter mishustinae TaxID=270918 RepID=UPI001CE06251|nr:phytanoyl-CoA dioxygenase family protein [Salegentibacter mishustinae]UBZ05593.1 phytanoyl-CoA dioxygenase family protein [Salegentibacter mishustinae]